MAITYTYGDGSSLENNLGQGHIIAGNITASAGTAAVVTVNDRSVTVTRTATGDYTLNFGQAFHSVPAAVFTAVNATFATTKQKTVEIVSAATDSVRVSLVDMNGTVTALTDQDFHFVIFGKRDN